jgi:hypothetical protein
MVHHMLQDDEKAILDFLKQESLQGHLESTTAEIANGIKSSYNQVGRVLERLLIKEQVDYRERGTEKKSVRYFYLKEVLELCKKKWWY